MLSNSDYVIVYILLVETMQFSRIKCYQLVNKTFSDVEHRDNVEYKVTKQLISIGESFHFQFTNS